MPYLNPVEVRNRLKDLADQIPVKDAEGGDRLRDLINDLGDAVCDQGENANAWAFCDVGHLISPERISDHVHSNVANDDLMHMLELLRNALVLLPLAITWIAIAMATDGYYQLITAKPDLAEQSFIFLWQSGFEGRTLLSLGTLAWIDGSLLATVFLLTLVVYTRTWWLGWRNGEFEREFRLKLEQALAEAQLVLAKQRVPLSLNEVREVLGNLNGSTQTLEMRIGALNESVGAWHLAMQGEVRTLGDGISVWHQTMQSESKALDDSVKALQKTMRQTSERLQELVSQQNEESRNLEAWIETQTSYIQEIGKAVEQFTRSTEAIKDIRDIALTLSEKQGGFIQQQSEIVEAMKKERQAQVRLTNLVSKMATEIESGWKEYREIVKPTAHGFAVDLTMAAETLPSVVKSFDSIHTVSQNLETVAREMAKASNGLNETVGKLQEIVALSRSTRSLAKSS